MEIVEVQNLSPIEILELRKLLIQKELVESAYKAAFENVRKELETSRRELSDDVKEVKTLVQDQAGRVTKLERFIYIATGAIGMILAVPTIAIILSLLSDQGVTK